jgi:hypothetical protein
MTLIRLIIYQMNASSEHFRFYVYVEAKRGQKPLQILQQLQTVFGDAAPGQAFVYKWCKAFESGNRNSVQSIPNPGRPISKRSVANISRVFDLISEDPKLKLAHISESLSLSKETVRRILVEDIMFRKVCSVWIPHKLSEQNKIQRVNSATNLLHLFQVHPINDLLRIFAVEDETWISFDLCASKEENKVWIPPGAKRPRVVRQQLTFRKTMLSIAFTGNGKLSVTATERGDTIDSESYVDFIHRTGELWRTLRSDPTRLSELLWMHDNARPHTAAHTQAFLRQRKVRLVQQSPYSPDLNLCDRWLFKELKSKLKVCQIQSASDVLTHTNRVFHQIPLEKFEWELTKLREHCSLIIACHGDYITK